MLDEAILLAGGTDKGIAMLQSLLPSAGTGSVMICRSGSEVRRAAAEKEYTYILINTPLNDENGLELAMELAQSSLASVTLFVKA